MEKCNALFVINQDINVSKLINICQKETIQSAVLLTTHRVFPSEREVFDQIGIDIKILSFVDLIDDQAMCKCDEAATNSLLKELGSDRFNYHSQFMVKSLYNKNRSVHDRLALCYNFNKIFYMPGLGISQSYWREKGLPLDGGDEPQQINGNGTNLVRGGMNFLRRAATLTRKIFSPTLPSIHVIRNNGKAFVFLSPLHRLRLRPETVVETGRTCHQQFAQEQMYCMTIHGYNRELAEELGGVWIFVDGYQPANYPRSYLDGYAAGDVFVVRTMFDERWFAANGRKTVKPPAFLDPEFFALCQGQSATRILVALNHAGDWTALINRSDTDDLVLAVAEMARRLPQLRFRIRLHPTADHPQHEGVHASKRLGRFVQAVKLGNLEISASSLSEDLAWCQVCLSEYSQVLLDAWRMGKLGVAVNLTRRRSFMQDYGDLGFFHVSSLEKALTILETVSHDPPGAAVWQNDAVRAYNELLRTWLADRSQERIT